MFVAKILSIDTNNVFTNLTSFANKPIGNVICVHINIEKIIKGKLSIARDTLLIMDLDEVENKCVFEFAIGNSYTINACKFKYQAISAIKKKYQKWLFSFYCDKLPQIKI
ncbi:hypothetical protein [Ferruginibacter sp. SUN106]|uniref:hypothetical protein n=1 Tax=Ferruginibacter sp. SUN106 TaxID=2978348 RepID=UPI003D35D538